MKNKIIKRAVIISFVLVLVCLVYIYREYNRTHQDIAKLKVNYSTNVNGLLDEFGKDERSSNAKYWDKVIRVDGTVKEINRDEHGLFAIMLGDTLSLSSVRCTVDSIHGSDVYNIRKGDNIIVKGICSGYNADELLGSDVLLVRCMIEKEK